VTGLSLQLPVKAKRHHTDKWPRPKNWLIGVVPHYLSSAACLSCRSL
jgi:hypothetical protein